MFCLARLLTGITAVICVLGHVVVVLVTRGEGAPREAWLADVRLWLAVFAFWAAVMWVARRPLRLDR